MIIFKLATTFLVAFLLVGCATLGQPKFNVKVSSLASAEAPQKKTYLLLPGNEGVTWEDLQFQEYASYVMRMLNSLGFKYAESSKNAELVVFLSYGIGDPDEHQYSYSLPVYGKTGVSSSSTYGTATAYGNHMTYSGTTVHTPSYGITGYNTYTGTRTVYFRYVNLIGYDFSEYQRSEKKVQLWKTTITSSGSSGDLRRVFPVLIGASGQYIGKNTNQEVSVSLHENDPSVRFVKGETEK
ncbi:hypothetical protein ASALC70_02061 [Alcanivorax sp. ALC70]|nr:hypothetical protein ASALC70_02061 [Alcanivorax sp. ALC70]